MSAHPLGALSALLDGELDDTERRAVEAHVATCPACARHLRELGAVDALARSLPGVAAPPGYHDALPARVRARIRAGRAPMPRAAWLWPLAAGLGLAVITPLVLRDGGAPESRVAAPREEQLSAPAPAPAASAGPEAEVREREEKMTAQEPPADRLARVETRPARKPAAPAAGARTKGGPPQALSAREQSDAGRAEATVGATTMQDRADPKAAGYATAPASDAAAAPALSGAAAPPAPAMRKSEADARAATTMEERAFRAAAAIPVSSAESARRAREAWLVFLSDHPAGARADEARVRLVEAAVAAYRATGNVADRRAAERHAADYLSSGAAPQASRVRSALRRLDGPR